MEEFNEQGSAWTLKSILGLTNDMNKLNQMRGSSYYIEAPEFINKKREIVNVKKKF